MPKLSIAVIGAGLAGLCAAKYAKHDGHLVTIFEQTGQLGGTWYYTDNVGVDEYGLKIHTSMYHNLRTNLPKEIMALDDFPIPQSPVSYISSDEYLSYIQSYAKHFELTKLIRYHNEVIRVHRLNEEKASEWEVSVQDHRNKSVETQVFDAILVCNGHNFRTYTPHFKDVELFEGRKMHSHDYRRASAYKDKTVLIIGGGTSGVDLSYALSETANKVIFSHHTHYDNHIYPSKVVKKGKIRKFTRTTVVFSDDTEEIITDVLFCTGFRYISPFLCEDSGIRVEDNYISPLYKHCINIKYPTMAFIGIPQVASVPLLVSIQTRFCMHYLNGNGVLPSESQMLEDTERDIGKRFAMGWPKKKAHCLLGSLQQEYYNDLAVTANIRNVRTVHMKIYYDSSGRRLNHPNIFRDDIYSIIDDENFERRSLSTNEIYRSN